MKKIKGFRHEKEFDTMTIVTDLGELPEADKPADTTADKTSDTKESIDRKTLAEARKDISEGQPTQVYEPRPLTPDDDIYEDIIEQFASAPTKPKYWFEEFGDYWSCSCGHINKGNQCKSCGLERELLRSLFILHKPLGAAGKLDKNLKKNKDLADKEAQQFADKETRRKEREASGEDLTRVIPIETDVTGASDEESTIEHKAPSNQSKSTEYTEVQIPKEHSIVPSETKRKKSGITFNIKAVIAIIACIVLIGICGFAIYKHLAAPAMQYEEAIALMESKKYEEAIEKFTALDDYNDSKDMIWECRVLIGDSHYDNGEFEKAIESYETAHDLKEDSSLYEKIRLCHIGIGDSYLEDDEYEKALGAYAVAADIAAGEDVQLKMNDAKYEYVKAYMSDRTSQVEEYMAELKDMNYPGIDEIYDEYYAWHTSIVANKSESDYSTDIDSVSRKDTVYFHVTLSGGEPSETLHLYYEVKWPDGHTEIYDLESGWKAGDKIAARFQYSIPLFGREGKMTFTLYDMNTKESLGSDSVTFKH